MPHSSLRVFACVAAAFLASSVAVARNGYDERQPARSGTAAAYSTSPALQARWTHSTKRDEMTGEISAFAFSPRSKPTRPMSFPYMDLTAVMAFGCDGDSEWAYINFSDSPNLTNTETEDGYNTFTTRVRWDEAVENTRMVQEWGATALHFRNGADAIRKMASASEALVELKWYGAGDVYFLFSMNGSSAAIASARQACSGS